MPVFLTLEDLLIEQEDEEFAEAMREQWVSTRLRNLCIKLRDSDDKELVYEKGAGWWIDCDKAFAPDVRGLLRYALISQESWGGNDKYQVWMLNEEGRALCDDQYYKPLIIEAMK